MTVRPVRIGVSACLFHEDPARTTFHGRPLAYIERSMGRFVGSMPGVVTYVVPELDPSSDEPASYASDLDGLVLAGGVDVSPRTYGEDPRRPEWTGDAIRDAYELALARAMIARDKPVLGICRGHQLLNVAFGGTLHQDILTDVGGALVHRDADVYEKLGHEIAIEPGSWLAEVYGRSGLARVNSVHHQAVKDPGKGVVIEARSTADGVIEAMRIEGVAWIRGVQWHPEFSDPADETTLDRRPLLASFIEACRARSVSDRS